jgi:hypothetical protein
MIKTQEGFYRKVYYYKGGKDEKVFSTFARSMHGICIRCMRRRQQ